MFALAQEIDLSGAIQVQVWHFQLHDFADPSPGIVEQEQQGIVPHSGTGVEVHRVEQRLHFVFFKVVDCFVPGAFEGDGADGLAVE